jgi:Fe-S-cluster containining protein
MPEPLANYRNLIARIDSLCSGITAALGDQITCSAGCSSCCTSITIFPVEAAAMREALDALPEEQAAAIKAHVASHADGERCPLLHQHRCQLYEVRPIICRTHGLPITYTSEGTRFSDCCPLNLSDGHTLSGANVVDLDKLNTLLAAVNSIYLTQTNTSDATLRIAIADALTQNRPK